MKKMNMQKVKSGVKEGLTDIYSGWKKIRPDVLVGVGVVGVVTAAVLACRQTPKAMDILEKRKEDLECVNKVINGERTEEYTEKDAEKDRWKINTRTGLELVKCYAVPIGMMGLSIAGLIYSHKEMKDRNANITAAMGALYAEYKDYRNRVKDRVGEETEQEIYHGLKANEVKEKVEDPETGKKTTQTVKEYGDHSRYAVYFDQSSKHWTKNAEHNKTILLQIQAWANERLKKRGKLFLWEVYEAMDIVPTAISYYVGWEYRPDDSSRDNYVDLGIFDRESEANRRFVNGLEAVILLDPNVDGVILKGANPDLI